MSTMPFLDNHYNHPRSEETHPLYLLLNQRFCKLISWFWPREHLNSGQWIFNLHCIANLNKWWLFSGYSNRSLPYPLHTLKSQAHWFYAKMNVLKETGRNAQLILRSDPTHNSQLIRHPAQLITTPAPVWQTTNNSGQRPGPGHGGRGGQWRLHPYRMSRPMIDTVIDYNISMQKCVFVYLKFR